MRLLDKISSYSSNQISCNRLTQLKILIGRLKRYFISFAVCVCNWLHWKTRPVRCKSNMHQHARSSCGLDILASLFFHVSLFPAVSALDEALLWVVGLHRLMIILHSVKLLTFHWLKSLSPTPPGLTSLAMPKTFLLPVQQFSAKMQVTRARRGHLPALPSLSDLCEQLGCWFLCYSCTTTLYQNDGIIQHTLVQCYLLIYCPSVLLGINGLLSFCGTDS